MSSPMGSWNNSVSSSGSSASQRAANSASQSAHRFGRNNMTSGGRRRGGGLISRIVGLVATAIAIWIVVSAVSAVHPSWFGEVMTWIEGLLS